MNPDIFAEWLQRQGQKVARTHSSYWVESGPRVYQAFPYHWQIALEVSEIRDFIDEYKAFAVRYSTPLTAETGRLSYHVVLERKPYAQNDLPKKARHDVKKGLESTRVEPIPLALLANEGWGLRRETLERQGRSGAETKEWWNRLCMSAEGLSGFEAWGAVVQRRLVAALLAFADEDCFSILYQQSLTGYLPFGVNNALAYVVTAEVLSRPEVARIFYGLHSLDAPVSVDEFKFRMGYEAKPVRQRVVFNPLIAPFINSLSHAGLKAVQRLFPAKSALSKAEGMLRFYLQGRHPLAHQDWPEILLKQKDKILSQIQEI